MLMKRIKQTHEKGMRMKCAWKNQGYRMNKEKPTGANQRNNEMLKKEIKQTDEWRKGCDKAREEVVAETTDERDCTEKRGTRDVEEGGAREWIDWYRKNERKEPS
jgi:hypothetical protein